MPELEPLKNMEYPGRLIVIGTSPDGDEVVMYAITGRSPSSQARKLERAEDRIIVKPTDEEILRTGDPDLLIYPAIIIESGIAVSNGKQTEDIPPHFARAERPIGVLDAALHRWEYEPDEPNYTPRISGCIFKGAALSIIKRSENGSVLRDYFELPLVPGTGRMIATYTGENINPLPSFAGEPIEIEIPYRNAEEAVTALYDALGPTGEDDFRVAAAAVYRREAATIALKNRHEVK
jgi:IMP cyclohydrolase